MMITLTTAVQRIFLLDLRQLFRHYFKHNRLAKALSIMPA